MDITFLTWINTLALLAAAVIGWREMREIRASSERMATILQRVEETAARSEELTRAVLLRLPAAAREREQ